MGRLSLYARERIVSLLSTNTSVVRITKSLNEEGIKVSRSAVNLFICRFRKTEILHDAPRSGRKLKLSDEQITFIDQKMRENDELTAAEIKQKLSEEFGVDISVATIKRVRRENLGWRSERARYCQFVREPNKMKRLIFCLTALEAKDRFEDAIFTDETSVQIEQYARICFHKEGTQPKRKGRPKHPLKV